jgi:WhiB family redox-sensing transcriptional regulator
VSGLVLAWPKWFADALCAQVGVGAADEWFPEQGGDPSVARAVCDQCPVRALCLDHALADTTLVGVWAGTTGRERGRIRGAA